MRKINVELPKNKSEDSDELWRNHPNPINPHLTGQVLVVNGARPRVFSIQHSSR